MKFTIPWSAIHLVAIACTLQGIAKEEPKKEERPAAAAAQKPGRDQREQAAVERSASINSADQEAIRKIAEQVQSAFNKHDADALAALFAEDAELVNIHGLHFRGRDTIRELFGELFEASPEARLKSDVLSIRRLASSLMIEQGRSQLMDSEDGPRRISNYTVLYTKEDGQWRMAYARDSASDENNEEHIKQLAWLIGDWMDETADAVVATSYHWSDSRQAIEGEFHVHAPGYPDMDGTIRIAWDPQAKQLRSWVFDSDGGYASGLWTETDDGWMIKMSGVLRDGNVTSATNILKQTGEDHASFQSVNRTVSHHALPDGDELTIVRHPPQPDSVGQK